MSGVAPPDWLAWAMKEAGLEWPGGDPAMLTIMSDDWRNAANELRQHKATGDEAAGNLVAHNYGKAIEGFDTWWNKKNGPNEFLGLAIQRADNMSAGLKAAASWATMMQSATVVAALAMVAGAVYTAAEMIGGFAVGGAAEAVGVGGFADGAEIGEATLIRSSAVEEWEAVEEGVRRGAGRGLRGGPKNSNILAKLIAAGVIGVGIYKIWELYLYPYLDYAGLLPVDDDDSDTGGAVQGSAGNDMLWDPQQQKYVQGYRDTDGKLHWPDGRYASDPNRVPPAHTRKSEYPSGYLTSTWAAMAAKYTDEGKANQIPAWVWSASAYKTELTWRDQNGSIIPAEQLTFDHIVPVVVHWKTVGYDTDRGTRAAWYNDVDNLRPMFGSLNSSEGGKLKERFDQQQTGPNYSRW